MLDQRVEAFELLLVADEAVERDFDLAAVKVAVEAEQVRFEQLDRRLEGRTDAEAGNAGNFTAVIKRHANGVDSVLRAEIVAEHKVRGWIAKLAPALVAALDHAL